MSIELITGKSATAHISANDFRAVNRANYGPGRYILKDADNMQTQVSAKGSIYIGRGSCMWSGMHIRCEDPTTLSFTPPTTRENIEVYLHYVKDVETLNESVEWVVSIGGDPSPIVDNVSDNTVEAYTMFALARMQADGTIGDTEYRFQLLDCHEDFDMTTIEKEYDFKLELKTSEMNAKIDSNEARISELEDSVNIYVQNTNVNDGLNITTSIDLSKYRYIVFYFAQYTASSQKVFHIVPLFMLPSFVQRSDVTCFCTCFNSSNIIYHNVGIYKSGGETWEIKFSPAKVSLHGIKLIK